MRKRSEQVYSRESSATLQLTVSLLYQIRKIVLLFSSVSIMICSYLTQSVCEWNTDILCTYFCKKEEKDVQIS